MNRVEILKTIAGVIILIFSGTVLMMAFSNNGLKALVVLFNFNLDITASNLGEAIAGAALGLAATLFFWLAMIFIGIVYLAISVNFGILTLTLKTSKAMTIIVLIFTSLSMFMEIRAISILARAELTSGILIAHLFGDIIVAGICVYSLIILYGFPEQLIEIAPKTTSSTQTEAEITAKPQITKFCPYCGMELKIKNKFCTNCGKSLTKSA